MRVYSRVLLPQWVFDTNDETEVKENVRQYMKRYPHYAVVRLEGKFALCEEMKGE